MAREIDIDEQFDELVEATGERPAALFSVVVRYDLGDGTEREVPVTRAISMSEVDMLDLMEYMDRVPEESIALARRNMQNDLRMLGAAVTVYAKVKSGV